MSSNRQISTAYPKSKRFKNRVGDKFGDWTIESFSHLIFWKTSKSRIYFWNCRCLCGKVKPIPLNNLVSGQSQSCGCTVRRKDKFRDLTGMTFGNFEVIDYDEDLSLQKNKSYWRGKCLICGKITSKSTVYLVRGDVRSCGDYKCRQINNPRSFITELPPSNG